MTVIAAMSATGVVRQRNEDCVSVAGQILEDETLRKFDLASQTALLIVADGMGGHGHGEVASRLVVESLNRQAPIISDIASCVGALQAANCELYANMKQNGALRGMGATIVGVQLRGPRAIWFNVGDSRAYLYRNGLQQLSLDHVPDHHQSGHRRSHAVTQSLGGASRPTDLMPAAGTVDLKSGDTILLCSDGLTDVLANDEISQIIVDRPTVEAVTQDLIEHVISKGAPDNTSIIIARV